MELYLTSSTRVHVLQYDNVTFTVTGNVIISELKNVHNSVFVATLRMNPMFKVSVTYTFPGFIHA